MSKRNLLDAQPGIKEMIGIAINTSDLTMRPDYRTSVDYLMAFSAATDIGEVLWAVKYGKQEYRLIEALDKFVKKMHGRSPRAPSKHFRALCHLALDEWTVDICFTCDGRGSIGSQRGRIEYQRVICGHCGGTGRTAHEVGLKYFLAGAMRDNEMQSCIMDLPCRDCHGRGYRMASSLNTEVRQCPTCFGTRKFTATDDARAEAAGMPLKMFKEWGKPRHAKMLAWLQRIDRLTLLQVAGRMVYIGGEVHPDDMAEAQAGELRELEE